MKTRIHSGICKTSRQILTGRIALATAALLGSTAAQAVPLYWDANGATSTQTDGAGAWLTANQWWTGSANTNWTSSDDAIFGYGGAGGAVTLASPTTVNSLTFNFFTGTYTLGTVGQAITLNNGITKNAGSGIVTIISPLTLGGAQTWTNNSTTNINVQAATILNGVLTVGGSGITSFDNASAIIGGSGGIIKNGTGQLNLSGATTPLHTFTGDITVNGGSIGFQTSAFLTGRNVKLTNGYLGGRFGSGFTWISGLGTGNNQIQITGGTSGFSGEGTTSSAFQIGTALSTLVWGASGEGAATGFFNPTVFLANGDARINAVGLGSLNNGINLNGTTRTITSLHTTSGAATSGFTISGAISNSTGTAGLIKTGVGNLILVAANTYNGATTITSVGLNQANGGGAVTLSGTGTINSTSAINLNGTGTLRLVNTAQVDRFADAAAITSNGGTISYENTASATISYTETIGSLGLVSDQVNLVLLNDQTLAGIQTLTINTGGITRTGGAANTSAVTFSAGGTGLNATKNRILVTGAGTSAFVGPWATTGTAANLQTDYAAYSADFVVPANIAATGEGTWLTSTDSYTHNGGTGGTQLLTATRNIAALRNTNTNVAATVDIATDIVTRASSTFANGDVVIIGGTAPGGTSTGTVYYVRDVLGATFKLAANSGGTAIDLTSAGTPTINAGIALATGVNLGTTGILNASATLGIGKGAGTGGVVTLPSTTSDNLHINAGNFGIILAAAIADNGAGVLTLVKNGSSTLNLANANTYTGSTIINAGTLQLGTNGQSNGASLGGGNYAGNIFIGAGASLNIQSNVAQILSGVISGDGSLTKNNGQLLTLGDSNTYTGKTTLTTLAPNSTGGANVLVSSFNSVNGGTPLRSGSSFGTPTTVANGTIDFGASGIQVSSTLRYAGSLATGETTDRVINFIFNNASSILNLDSSGSGLLKFTSAPTSNGTAGQLVLLGTAAGAAGEFTQGLPFASTSLTKSGTGTWTLGGPVGSTGSFSISAGTLIATHVQALGTAIGNLITSGPTIGGTGSLSLRNDSSVTFGVGGTGYNINNSVSGAIINVDRVSGTGSNTLTVGNLTTTSTAATWGLNFTGANGVSLSAGTLTTPTSTLAAIHTITNNISGVGSLTLAAVVDAATTVANPSLVFTGTGNTTVTGAITQAIAAMTLTKTGTGTLTLSGANTYTGVITVSAGTLEIASIAANNTDPQPLGAASSDILIGSAGSGGTLRYSGSLLAALQRNITVNGAGGGTVSNIGGNTLTLSGTLTKNGRNLTLNAGTSSPISVTGAIVGASANSDLFITGSSTVTVSNNNTYVGPTTVGTGSDIPTLAVVTGGSLSGTTGVTVKFGGTLLISGGTVNSAATVTGSGGTVAIDPSQTGVTHTFASLTLTNNSVLDFSTSNSNRFLFAGAASAITLGGSTLRVNGWTGNGYDISETADHGDLTQDRLLFTNDPGFGLNAAIPGISFYNDSGNFIGNGIQVSFGSQFEIVPVPEPATTALIGFVALCALIGYREPRRFVRGTRDRRTV